MVSCVAVGFNFRHTIVYAELFWWCKKLLLYVWQTKGQNYGTQGRWKSRTEHIKCIECTKCIQMIHTDHLLVL